MERINISIFLEKEKNDGNFLDELIHKFLVFEPTEMQGKILTKGDFKPFDSDYFFSGISKDFNSDSINIHLEDDLNSIRIYQKATIPNVVIFTCTVTLEIYEEHHEKLLNNVDEIMLNRGIVTKVQSMEDYFWQNNTNLNSYKYKNKLLNGVPLKKCDIFPDDTIVDVERLPGHDHIVKGIWFGSCWKMWCGKHYFQYIPKNILLSYKECYSNQKLSDDCICITLYQNVLDYDKEASRKIQWDFRKKTGIDIVAHELEKKQVDVENTSVEINSGLFEHGGVKQLKYYYDLEGNITLKKKAKLVKIAELNEEGKIIWEGQENIE